MSELGDLMRAEDWRLEYEDLQKRYNKFQQKLETERQEHAEAQDKFLDINEKLRAELATAQAESKKWRNKHADLADSAYLEVHVDVAYLSPLTRSMTTNAFSAVAR